MTSKKDTNEMQPQLKAEQTSDGVILNKGKEDQVKMKTLVLDMDETLIHSRFEYMNREYESYHQPDLVFTSKLYGADMEYSVYKRPKVDEFLDTVSKWYNLVVYTAGDEAYATKILDFLDNGRGILNKRFFKQHCIGSYCPTKDLKIVDEDLSNVAILDNSPSAYRNYKENGIPIKSWYDDNSDNCLEELIPMFDKMRNCEDVREFLKEHLKAE